MSQLITSAVVAGETLELFVNNLVFSNRITWHTEEFERPTDKVGNTYTLRRPVMVRVTENNMAWNAADSQLIETAVTLVVDRTLTVPMSFSDGDLALKLEKFSERYVKPTARLMAAKADTIALDSIINSKVSTLSATSGLATAGLGSASAGSANAAGYVVGAYGTALTPAVVAFAHKVLADQGCPEDGDIFGVLSTSANSALVLAQASLFNPLTDVDKLYRKGLIGMYDGIQFAQTQSLPSHTNGSQATLEVDATTSGAIDKGWAEFGTINVAAITGSINAGDVFQAPAGVYVVNPLTKTVTDLPFQMTVVTAAASGTTVKVSPCPIFSGPYQNVSADIKSKTFQLTGSTIPGVTPDGSSAVGLSGVESLIFHKSAIVAASPLLTTPKKSSYDMAESISDDELDTYRLRLLRSYDMLGVSGTSGDGGVGSSGPSMVSRVDSMFGIKTTNTAWICRVRG